MDLTSEQKGRRAQEILDDSVFHEAVDTIRTNILVQWNLTEADQADERESAYHKSRALDEILRELRILVADWAVDQSRNKIKKGRKQ
jgi:glycerol-3-phosphate O-acyltransferase